MYSCSKLGAAALITTACTTHLAHSRLHLARSLQHVSSHRTSGAIAYAQPHGWQHCAHGARSRRGRGRGESARRRLPCVLQKDQWTAGVRTTHHCCGYCVYLLTHSPSCARSPLTSYLKTTRKVCMSEFDYEIQMVFDNLDNFKVSERRS